MGFTIRQKRYIGLMKEFFIWIIMVPQMILTIFFMLSLLTDG